MKSKSVLLAIASGLVLSTVSSLGAPKPKISATAKISSSVGGPEITTLTFGQAAVYTVTGNNLDLVANQRVTAEYTISVRPNDASAPVILTGRLNLTATLPADKGGATQTTQDATAIAGPQSLTGTFIAPASLPEGTAKVTISLSTGTAGKITITKSIQLKAD